MPPLARPTRPRQPWRRVASTSWRSAAPAANPPRPNASSGAQPRRPRRATATTSAAAPHHAGQNSRSRSSSPLALRHGSTGATAIRNSSSDADRHRQAVEVRRADGDLPVLQRLDDAAGTRVPSSTTNANTVNSTLLARNAPSRDTGESIAPGERSRSPRQAISAERHDDDEAEERRAGTGRPVPSPNAWTLVDHAASG